MPFRGWAVLQRTFARRGDRAIDFASQQPETIEATDCSEPVGDDDFVVESVEKQENKSKLELEQNNVLKSDSGHKNLTEDKGASLARPNFVRYSRKLQPVEILTAAGEWVGGFFIHSCIAVANSVGTERRFTLFDADGVMYGFLGQIRPPQKIVGATKGAG